MRYSALPPIVSTLWQALREAETEWLLLMASFLDYTSHSKTVILKPTGKENVKNNSNFALNISQRKPTML